MTLEAILRTVLHAVAWSALVAFCGVVAGVGVCWMLRLLRRALAETGRRCGKWAAMMLTSIALICAVVAQKANTNDAPNGVPASMMSAARGAPETYLQNPTTAPETPPLHLGSVARGAPQTFPPRLEAQIPANAQDAEEWELRGAYDDAIRIPAVGWDFRTTNGFIEGMTVFSRGEFRPDVGHLYFPRPFTNDLALLPRAKWHLLRGVAATPSSSQGPGALSVRNMAITNLSVSAGSLSVAAFMPAETDVPWLHLDASSAADIVTNG